MTLQLDNIMCGARVRAFHALLVGPLLIWAAQNNKLSLITGLGVFVIAVHTTLLVRDGQLKELLEMEYSHPKLNIARLPSPSGHGPYAQCARCVS